MKIKAEVANEMQPAQAQELLKSIYCLLNIAETLIKIFWKTSVQVT